MQYAPGCGGGRRSQIRSAPSREEMCASRSHPDIALVEMSEMYALLQGVRLCSLAAPHQLLGRVDQRLVETAFLLVLFIRFRLV